MTDEQLRAMIRDSIAKHLGAPGPREPLRSSFDERIGSHASHGMLPLLRGGDGDGACIIEPSVRCNHCGYCQSFGH